MTDRCGKVLGPDLDRRRRATVDCKKHVRMPVDFSPLSCSRAVLWRVLGTRRRNRADEDQDVAPLRPPPLTATAWCLATVLVRLLLGLGLASSATAATVPDTMAQRTLACTGCHTPAGQASTQGYIPRITGKPAGYLAAQLRAFRDGQRQQDAMARLLANLDDAFLAEMATYFARQTVDAQPAQVRPAAAAARAAGQRIVQRGDASRDVPACVACHGTALTGVEPSIPGLLGLPRDYLVAQLGAWRTGVRRAAAPDCMAQVARRLTPDDITAVADWLVAQPLPAQRGAAAAVQHQLPLPCGSLDR